MDIENIAVSAVCESLDRTELLKSFINSGDKEPSWDGHIYVYHHVSQKKCMLSGRVPAQVKGKKVKSLDNLGIISFSVEVADLNNYFKDGGIFYFVVYITKNKSQIFYASLLPFDIKEFDINEKNSITINDNILPLDIEYSQKTTSEIENLKERLIIFKKIQAAFDLAGNKIEIDISTFSERDWMIAAVVTEAFLEKKPVKLNINDDCGFCKLKIGNTGLLLYGYKTDNGYFSLDNPFRQGTHILLYEKREGFDNIALSIFCLLNKDDFVIGTNIDYDFVYKDIVQIDFNNRYSGYVNHLLLEILRAYDIGTKDNAALIACAEKISEWLYQSTNDDMELLNLLQVRKRQRELLDEEVQQLYDLVESGTKDHKKLTGVYILLGESSGAQRHYNQMSPEEQNYFDTFPIVNLWKRNHTIAETHI